MRDSGECAAPAAESHLDQNSAGVYELVIDVLWFYNPRWEAT